LAAQAVAVKTNETASPVLNCESVMSAPAR
jgi:hypothetical protein